MALLNTKTVGGVTYTDLYLRVTGYQDIPNTPNVRVSVDGWLSGEHYTEKFVRIVYRLDDVTKVGLPVLNGQGQIDTTATFSEIEDRLIAEVAWFEDATKV
jgi:hypothetical protein